MKKRAKNTTDRAAPHKTTVIKELRLPYVIATPATWSQVELACTELGWSKTAIVKQMIHGFMAVDGSFYARAGQIDAQARGMTEEDYFRTLRDKSEEALPRYLEGRPAFGRTPLDAIDDVTATIANKHRYNKISLSAYNLVLLRVAKVVDGGTLVQVVARMIVKHLQDKWERHYLPQIERDQQCRFF